MAINSMDKTFLKKKKKKILNQRIKNVKDIHLKQIINLQIIIL
jgi:hypothetical protein